jgi:hypothetical protein
MNQGALPYTFKDETGVWIAADHHLDVCAQGPTRDVALVRLSALMRIERSLSNELGQPIPPLPDDVRARYEARAAVAQPSREE